MKIEQNGRWFTFIKEKTDKIYKESLLYYKIKQELNKIGFDLIKKSPDKDGHLTSAPYYLRDKKFKHCFFDNNHQIRDLKTYFNENGYVELEFIEI